MNYDIDRLCARFGCDSSASGSDKFPENDSSTQQYNVNRKGFPIWLEMLHGKNIQLQTLLKQCPPPAL